MIEVSGLSYTYPGGDTPCLKNISFSVAGGEMIGVIGPNKAGKSTLCYALMGLVPHFYHGTISGGVLIDGVNVLDANLAEMAGHVGIVFQNPANQFSGAKLTVEDEIAFGLENFGMPRAMMRERIDWVINMLGIAGLRNRDPFQLSGGQMQRVAIASVLALKPKVLVLDEPTSQLDPQGTTEVFSALQILQGEGITIVVVEHDTEMLAKYCTRFAVVVAGDLKLFDTPERVFSHPQLYEWGVGVPPYVEAYRQIVVQSEMKSQMVPETLVGKAVGLQAVPATLDETARRLLKYAKFNRR